jgi:hypothetical protein
MLAPTTRVVATRARRNMSFLLSRTLPAVGQCNPRDQDYRLFFPGLGRVRVTSTPTVRLAMRTLSHSERSAVVGS